MNHLKNVINDFSISSSVAGLIAVIVGMTSSAVLVFQAAEAFGVNASDAGSWLGSLCLAMGLISIVFSIKTKVPVLIAWSTPGTVLLISAAQGFTLSEAVGAFFLSSSLVLLFGITGWFEKIMNRIPVSLAAALLAGVLFHFCVDLFSIMNGNRVLIGLMLIFYIIGRKFWSNWTMLGVFVCGLVLTFINGSFIQNEVHFSITNFHFTYPSFSPSALFSIGIPLFIVTMASQNLTGISVIRSHGFNVPISGILTYLGLAGMFTSFFGGFAINFAALTASIAMGEDSHPNPNKRYIAGVVSGTIYLAIGIFAGTVTSIFSIIPREVISAIAGFALLTTVCSGLEKALGDRKHKEANFLTFVIAASGFTLFGIGAAFWAIVIGTCLKLFNEQKTS